MNAYKVSYLYVPNSGGRTSKGSVSVLALSMEAARQSFYAVYATAAGQHSITQVEALAHGELF